MTEQKPKKITCIDCEKLEEIMLKSGCLATASGQIALLSIKSAGVEISTKEEWEDVKKKVLQ